MTAARPIVMKNIAVAGLKIKMNASKTARYICIESIAAGDIVQEETEALQ